MNHQMDYDETVAAALVLFGTLWLINEAISVLRHLSSLAF